MPLGGIPSSTVVRLRYATECNFQTDVYAGQYKSFRANGLYDPDVQLGGHQPMGFTYYKDNFHEYVVIGSKATYNYTIANSSSNYGQYTKLIGLMLDDDGIINNQYDAQEIIEQGKGKWKLHNTGHADTNVPKKMSIKYSPKKHFGINNIKDNTDNIGAKVDADPTKSAYYIVYNTPIYTGVPSGIMVEIKGVLVIDYIVLFTNRKNG